MTDRQLFEPQDPKLWEPDVPPPTDVEHEQLLVDPEAREARRASRLGSIALPTLGKPRGRQREDLTSPGQLSLEYPSTISEESVRAVALAVKDKQPLFDKFSRGYKVLPTKQGIDNYVLDLSKKTPQREEKRTPKQRKQALLRKSHHIADRLQHETLSQAETANLRLWSIAAVQHAIREGLPIDPQAGLTTAQAIYDFGNALIDPKNRKLLEEHDLLEHVDTITYIGEMAQDDAEILRSNSALLRLVRIEQKARKAYWAARFEATRTHLGDRLTNSIRENTTKNIQEIVRLDALIRGR